jgi:hypothetical protein
VNENAADLPSEANNSKTTTLSALDRMKRSATQPTLTKEKLFLLFSFYLPFLSLLPRCFAMTMGKLY